MSKEKLKRAVGLEYHPARDDAPLVAVNGENLVADQIVGIARRFGIPVVDDPQLAQALAKVELDTEIPENMFEAVAILLNQLKAK